MAPYYRKYIDKLRINENAELILVPLCNGSHFYGYVIDLERNISVHIDSMYPRKSGRRSIGARLIETGRIRHFVLIILRKSSSV